MSEAPVVAVPESKRWRNFDIFDLILNHGQ